MEPDVASVEPPAVGEGAERRDLDETGAIDVTVIVPTCNERASLHDTLCSIGRALAASSLTCEVVVVDSAAPSSPAPLVEALGLPRSRVVAVERRGAGRARQAGLEAARGRVVAFVDDDVVVDGDWLEPLCRPILSGAADATAGQIRLSGEILGHSPSPMVRIMLAERLTERLTAGATMGIVGANFAVRRDLATTIGFHPALGPGALGAGEEALFEAHLRARGATVRDCTESFVTHHPGLERLQRQRLRRHAASHGRSDAFLRSIARPESVPPSPTRLLAHRLAKRCVVRPLVRLGLVPLDELLVLDAQVSELTMFRALASGRIVLDASVPARSA